MLLSPQRPSGQAAFDVASIKESKSLASGGGMRLMPDGGIRAQHIPARFLITIAFDLKGFQLIGAPDWLATTYYDVSAKPEGTATRAQTFAMLQQLLIDRFKLVYHREPREIDGYSLVQARPGTLGPNMKPSALDCSQPPAATTPRCREGRITETSMKGSGVSTWNLLLVLAAEIGAPIVDNTQLTGTFDVDLRWSTEMAPANDLPTISTAIQEQLGLKLERARVTSEAFIIDRIERPTPD